MADVLYRKYRSRAFGEVQGQEAIISVLTNSLANGKFAHAYLFAGPRGTGKTTVARLVAKAVNCEQFAAKGDVCNECASCLAVEAGNHIDVVEIDAASNRGIEEIRQIRDTINFLPNSGKCKVYIIDEAHMLTREAFNALLKTLEEPPAHVVFIMATTEPHKVPVTILSRVQRFDFKLATPEQLAAKLASILEQEGQQADPEVIDMIFKYSEGSYRDAESLLGKILSNHKDKQPITITEASAMLGIPSTVLVQELIRLLVTGNSDEGLAKIAEIVTNGSDLNHLVKSMTAELRNQVVEIVKASKPYDRELLVLHTLMGLQSELKTVDDARLLLEVAMLKLGKAEPVKAAKPLPENIKQPEPQPKRTLDLPKSEAAPKSEDGGVQWQRLLGEVRKADFRLWTILKSCSAVLNGDQLVLLTSYKSSATVLQEPEVVSKLRPLLDMVYSAALTMEVSFNGPQHFNADTAGAGDFALDSNASLVEEIF